MQRFKTTITTDDTLTIPVVGKWNLIALEAKYEGYPCLGTAWFEPEDKSGVWASKTAVGLARNGMFCGASNLFWHGKLPLHDGGNNRVIVGLRGGEIGAEFSLSILLEEK